MTLQELREKSVEELCELLGQARERVRVFRFEACAKTFTQVHAISAARREIAQILTLLSAKGGKRTPL